MQGQLTACQIASIRAHSSLHVNQHGDIHGVHAIHVYMNSSTGSTVLRLVPSVPTQSAYTTLPSNTPPSCPSSPSLSQVTTTSFGATFSLDTAGAVYYVISPLPGSTTYVEPGSIVGPFGTTLVAPPTPATTPIYFTETLTVRGQPDTVTVNIPNTTVSSSSRHLMQQTNTMDDDSNDALGFSPWDDGFLSGASESAMLRYGSAHCSTQEAEAVYPRC